jgi:acetyl esterase/lipase
MRRKDNKYIDIPELIEKKENFNPLIEEVEMYGVKTYVIAPQKILPENEDKIMLYIHGGGFILGSATDRTGMLMINEMGIKTYSTDYSLAPEAKFPVALNEFIEVCRFLIQSFDSRKIIGISASTGCTHRLSMLLKAHQEGLPMINSIALFSPAADLTGNGDSAISNEGRCLLAIKNQSFKIFVFPFAGSTPLTDPLVSPIYSDYPKTFPPTSIISGTRDLFLSNGVRLFWKLKVIGVRTELITDEGM